MNFPDNNVHGTESSDKGPTLFEDPTVTHGEWRRFEETGGHVSYLWDTTIKHLGDGEERISEAELDELEREIHDFKLWVHDLADQTDEWLERFEESRDKAWKKWREENPKKVRKAKENVESLRQQAKEGWKENSK